MMIVSVEEDPQHNDVHEEVLGEGEGFTHEARESLAQCEVEAFNVVGLSFLFGAGLMVVFIQHLLVGVEQVAVAEGVLVLFWHLGPQCLTSAGASITPHPRHDLPGSAAQHHPNPHAILLTSHVTPHLIHL